MSPVLATARARQNAFIGAFLLLQLAVPLHYYLSDRGADERFSWRMFSTVRLQRCRVDVEAVTPKQGVIPIAPARDIQVAWVNLLKRYRPPVVARYLERVCEQQGARQARYRRRCIDTDGAPLPTQEVVRDCANHNTTWSEVTP